MELKLDMEPLDSNVDDKHGILANREDLSLVTKETVTNDQIIDAAINLQMGQTQYQNNTFVVGSQITPYKKVQQALLELETRNHGFTELKYKHRLCINNRKVIERALKVEEGKETPDELEVERLQIELEKAYYDESIYERKMVTYDREIREFCDMVREHMEEGNSIEHYRVTNETEDRKYWISRLAKQAAVDVHAIGRLGSGNLDSILNMPREDQLLAVKGAVEHATLLTAGVERMQQQLLPEVRKIMEQEYDKLDLPKLLGQELANEPMMLPEVTKHDDEKIDKEATKKPEKKFRIQSSRKPEAG